MNTDRVLPHDVDAESSFLGGLLFFPDALADVLTEAKPEDFHDPGNRQIFEAIARVSKRGESVTCGTVRQELRGADVLIEANPALLRATAYELLGFAAGAKLYCRTPGGALRFVRAWAKGHRAFVRDRHELSALCKARPGLELLVGRTELTGSTAVLKATQATSAPLDAAHSSAGPPRLRTRSGSGATETT